MNTLPHSPQAIPRYNDVAVGLHWIIAALIMGLLAVGKFMTGLPENDVLRFVLTQWHKTFGILVLLLIIIRLIWRLTHKPPEHPPHAPAWEKLAANGSHIAMYLLMVLIPVSGWALVSASTLNIDTLLFNVIPWPHLPGIEPGDALAHRLETIHELAGTAMIVLLLVHVAAALKHHFKDKDTVLTRMLPDWSSAAFRRKTWATALAVSGISIALYVYANNRPALVVAGASEVGFTAIVTSSDVQAVFANSNIDFSYDPSRPENTTISAVVETASVDTTNFQVEGSLPDPDWFDSNNYPEATFNSTRVVINEDKSLQIFGDLTMKATTRAIEFPMTFGSDERGDFATGEFVVNRLDYAIGADSQPSDDSVGLNVTIRFRFETGTDSNE